MDVTLVCFWRHQSASWKVMSGGDSAEFFSYNFHHLPTQYWCFCLCVCVRACVRAYDLVSRQEQSCLVLSGLVCLVVLATRWTVNCTMCSCSLTDAVLYIFVQLLRGSVVLESCLECGVITQLQTAVGHVLYCRCFASFGVVSSSELFISLAIAASASWNLRLQILLMGTCRQCGSRSVAGHNHRKVIWRDPICAS